jgi:RHS repeat-associated protein
MFLHSPSGLYLSLNRAYDPYSGRWLSRDPAGEVAGGVDLYAYTGDDPINERDPNGLQLVGLAGAAVAAATGFGGNVFGQLATNDWHISQVDWRSAGWAFVTGGGVGFGLTTPGGSSLLGAIGIGAAGNLANYGLSTPVSQLSFGGTILSLASGAFGSLVGGTIPNPYTFITVSPALNDLNLVGQIIGPKSFIQNFLGALISAWNYSHGIPGIPNASGATPSTCQK